MIYKLNSLYNNSDHKSKKINSTTKQILKINVPNRPLITCKIQKSK